MNSMTSIPPNIALMPSMNLLNTLTTALSDLVT